MNAERWKIVDNALQSALELPSERVDEFLRQACAGDTSLMEEVKSLMVSQRNASDFLEQPAIDLAAHQLAETESLPPESLVGHVISQYRILKMIGSGGMGNVWLGERCDGRFERKAAIKFLHFSELDRVGAERFKREGRMLARLRHPNIAELLDAGFTSSGEPFLVLEYVEGLPIDAYCDQQSLGIEARIRLFIGVLDAVEHAHTNLIVHRDLKPSNILVTGDGQVKLLDFGIAKLLADDTTAASVAQITRECGAALTLRFAAPEQVTDGPITTATDVYALGVLLYLLLTGQHPAGVGSHSPAQLLRALIENSPPRASEVAVPQKVRRRLRGDLDTILGKALKKEPGERYAIASAFANDLRRFLRDEPISARPDAVAYRARKFFHRNRFAVSASVLALAAILIASGIAIYQARIAQQRFHDVRQLANTFVFDLYDEVAKLDGSTKAREMMVQTGRTYLDNLARSAGSDLELQNEIAAAYMKIGDAEGYPTKPNLGRLNDALASYQKAGDIYRRISASDPKYLPMLADYDLKYAGLVRFTHDLPHARASAEAAMQAFDRIRTRRALTGSLAAEYVHLWCVLGDLDEDMMHYGQSWTEFSHCRDLARAEIYKQRDRQSRSLLSEADERVGTAAAEQGLLAEAVSALNEDESVLKELLAAEPHNPVFHRRLMVAYHYRAEVYDSDATPSYDDAQHAIDDESRYRAAAEAMVQNDPSNTSAQFSRAVASYALSFPMSRLDPKTAVKLARDAVQRFDTMLDSGQLTYLVRSRRVRAILRLGEAQLKARQTAAAYATAQEALETERQLATKDGAEWSEERVILVQCLRLAAETARAVGDGHNGESYLIEARSLATKIAQSGELSSLIPLANVERTGIRFYGAQHRSKDVRACKSRLESLWRSFPDTNEFVRRQRALVQVPE